MLRNQCPVSPEYERYIGRYSKRACLSEYKITQMEGEYISFRYKDYKNLNIKRKAIERELRLHYSDFFPRLLQHVPLPYFRIVRYYGLYSNKGEIAEEYLYRETLGEDGPTNDCGSNELEDPLYCEQCKMKKEYQHTQIEKRTASKAEQQPTIVYRRPIRKIRNAA